MARVAGADVNFKVGEAYQWWVHGEKEPSAEMIVLSINPTEVRVLWTMHKYIPGLPPAQTYPRAQMSEGSRNWREL